MPGRSPGIPLFDHVLAAGVAPLIVGVVQQDLPWPASSTLNHAAGPRHLVVAVEIPANPLPGASQLINDVRVLGLFDHAEGGTCRPPLVDELLNVHRFTTDSWSTTEAFTW